MSAVWAGCSRRSFPIFSAFFSCRLQLPAHRRVLRILLPVCRPLSGLGLKHGPSPGAPRRPCRCCLMTRGSARDPELSDAGR